jgi:polar amino acid transport system permease protein
MKLQTLSWNDVIYLLAAARYTILLSLLTFIGGGIAGLAVTAAKLSRARSVRLLAQVYVELMQSTPLLIQLFIWFFLLSIMGVQLPATVAAALALTLNATAFFAEIWRGSIQAISRTQWEASAAIGMTRLQQVVYIIAPQAVRIAMAPTVGLMVQIIKGTSLTALVGFVELTRAGQLVTSTTFRPLATFGIVALMYLAMCLPLSLLSQRLERKLNVGNPLDIGL